MRRELDRRRAARDRALEEGLAAKMGAWQGARGNRAFVEPLEGRQMLSSLGWRGPRAGRRRSIRLREPFNVPKSVEPDARDGPLSNDIGK